MGLFNIFSKDKKEDLDRGLTKTREGFFQKLTRAVAGKSRVDDEVLDKLEETLVMSDVGVATTLKIIGNIEARIAKDKYLGTDELQRVLKEEITDLLRGGEENEPVFSVDAQPYVIMVVGVNGVGKTTTIGKLAWHFKQMGKNVVLGAADTFRAAAIEQLNIWGERVDAPVVSQRMGADPASVAYDTLQSALSRKADVAIIDTAGRLHNKANLMRELSKTKNVMKKVLQDAPHEVLLVLDATTGQNAFEQARQFTEATEVNALAVTKLDGTAKGGVVLGVSNQFNLPVKYIGVGEQIKDIQLFNKYAFVDSLFNAG